MRWGAPAVMLCQGGSREQQWVSLIMTHSCRIPPAAMGLLLLLAVRECGTTYVALVSNRKLRLKYVYSERNICAHCDICVLAHCSTLGRFGGTISCT